LLSGGLGLLAAALQRSRPALRPAGFDSRVAELTEIGGGISACCPNPCYTSG
jgi:hypothetical protein